MCAKDLVDYLRDLEAGVSDREARRPRPILRSAALQGIEAVERVEAELEPLLDALREAIPRLVLHRRHYDGAWQVGLALSQSAEPEPRGVRDVGRLVFDLRVDPARRQHVDVECRWSAASHDEPAHGLRVNAALDCSELRAFAEGACRAFGVCLLECGRLG